MKYTKHNYIKIPALKTIYAPVPKAANSSIKSALANALPTPPKNNMLPTKHNYWRPEHNPHTDTISAQQAISLSNEGWFTFTMVRHPLDRLVSCYNNKVIENRDVSPAMRKCGIYTGMKFGDFIQIVANTPDYYSDIHLASQWFQLSHRGRLVPQFIGYFENLEADYQKISANISRVSNRKIGRLPKKNVRRANSDSYMDYYNEETLTLAATRYHIDLELFYPREKELVDIGQSSSKLLHRLRNVLYPIFPSTIIKRL